jgi:hypothetical protein
MDPNSSAVYSDIIFRLFRLRQTEIWKHIVRINGNNIAILTVRLHADSFCTGLQIYISDHITNNVQRIFKCEVSDIDLAEEM